MLYPLQNISITLMKVLFPAFSTLQDDNQKFKTAYLKVIFALALVTFPIMIGLMATAIPLVNVVFGNKWEGLGLLLVILAPSGLLRSIYSTVGTLFMAKGNTRTQLKLGTVNAVLTVIGFIIGLQWGINGVAISYLIVNIFMLYPTFKISWKQIELNIWEGLKILIPILWISILMGIGTYFTGEMLQNFIDSELLILIFMIATGILLYIFMLRLKYGNLKQLIKSIKN
jgi:PST family polysaccharide transporter